MQKTMAGCVSNRVDVQRTEASFDFESEGHADVKLKHMFDEFVKVFLNEFCGVSCFRPLPPVIGGEGQQGQEVDLFRLHIVVRQRGGYRSVSGNWLWGSVATGCGFDSCVGAALKLTYVKYLYTLDRWLLKIVEDPEEEKIGVKERYLGFRGPFMDLESGMKAFLSGASDKVKKEGEFVEFKKSVLVVGGGDGKGFFVGLNADVKSVDEKLRSESKIGVNVGEKQCDGKGCNGDEQVMTNEDAVDRKRKRECFIGMLNWLVNIAKDPCNPAIGSLPERNKWKYYGSDVLWKRTLLAREAMLLKRNVDATSEQSWQKKQKMHPGMYDDTCGSDILRCSQRLLFAKDSSRKAREQPGSESSSSGCHNDEFADKQSDSTAESYDFWFKNHRHKRVPLGPLFQAELPEFNGRSDYESDSKWLGTPIWPLQKDEQKKNLIERDRIGKGRQESCGCQFPGSIECVKFHVREKGKKLRLELGSAFYKWKFSGMGEDVALFWKRDEQNRFAEIVKSNCLSSEKYFWEELFNAFPNKGREALVSYYFNVYLLRRMAELSRSGDSNIESDDEDSEYGPVANRFGRIAANSPGSIFCSPKKSHSNSK